MSVASSSVIVTPTKDPHMLWIALLASFPLVLLAACDTGVIPDQLEAFSAVPDGLEDDYKGATVEGTLAATGSLADFDLAVAPTDGSPVVTVTVHSPGHSMLADLDGISVRTVLSDMGLDGERSLFLFDEHGPLYIGNVGFSETDVAALFGTGFAAFGETVGTHRDKQYDWTYTTGVFQTDDGPVSLLPGEADTFLIGGDTWRMVVIAAYQVDPRPNAALPCGGISDLLSYEMLRVTTAPEPETIVPTAGDDFAYIGCL
jgi:hypothetical protein